VDVSEGKLPAAGRGGPNCDEARGVHGYQDRPSGCSKSFIDERAAQWQSPGMATKPGDVCIWRIPEVAPALTYFWRSAHSGRTHSLLVLMSLTEDYRSV
jgi:hypothetical protein